MPHSTFRILHFSPRPQMLNVALTGNIAAGKSTVAELFRRWGATLIDADSLVREVQAPGTAVLAAIARRFGADVLRPDGSLNRDALRAKVMGDDTALAALNALVHPAVERRREALLDAAWKRGDRIVVNDIPLLFEALDPSTFDVVVLVDAPAAVRRARLRALRGLGDEEADRMIAAQMPTDHKRKRSHFVIDNDGTLEMLERRARKVYAELERRAAAKHQA
jgi:dephospho-CoA kinase